MDGFVSVGGGSSIDTAKVANLVVSDPADVMEYVNAPIGAGRKPAGPLLAHLAIPTTGGSGSEATTVAVVDLPELSVKSGISDRCLRPAQAIVDPELLGTLPGAVVAATGLDVVCHAAESFLARPFDSRPRPASPGSSRSPAALSVHAAPTGGYRTGACALVVATSETTFAGRLCPALRRAHVGASVRASSSTSRPRGLGRERCALRPSGADGPDARVAGATRSGGWRNDSVARSAMIRMVKARVVRTDLGDGLRSSVRVIRAADPRLRPLLLRPLYGFEQREGGSRAGLSRPGQR